MIVYKTRFQQLYVIVWHFTTSKTHPTYQAVNKDFENVKQLKPENQQPSVYIKKKKKQQSNHKYNLLKITTPGIQDP